MECLPGQLNSMDSPAGPAMPMDDQDCHLSLLYPCVCLLGPKSICKGNLMSPLKGT